MSQGRRNGQRSAEIVVVGGGIIGLSIAFHLAEQGARDVLVLERDRLASGSTSKATGGIRQQFSTEVNVRLSNESVRFYEDFDRRLGAPFEFRRIGYLMLAGDDALLGGCVESARLQNSLGIPTEIISPDEVRARFPPIDVTGLTGASFCPTDGAGSPTEAAHGFAGAARALGVDVVEGSEVVAIETANGRIDAVRTRDERIATPLVVNAAGPWAAPVSRLAGASLPITARPRQAFVVAAGDRLGAAFPLTVDLQTGVYVLQDARGIVLGGGDRVRDDGYEATLDWSMYEPVARAAVSRVPSVAPTNGVSGWCGLRDMTPDEHAILGPLESPAGLWCAAGTSGHGFMHAPAIGRIMAEWILRGRPSGFDLADVAIERFSERPGHDEMMVF